MQCCTNLPPVTQNFASQEPLRDQSVELWQIFHSAIKLRPSEDLMTNHVSLLKHLPYSSPTTSLIATFQFGQFCDWFPGCYRQQGPQRCFETEAFNLHEKSKLTLDWLFQIKLLHCHSSARWWSIHMLLSVEPGNFKGKTVQFRQRRVWEMIIDSQSHISVIKRKFCCLILLFYGLIDVPFQP